MDCFYYNIMFNIKGGDGMYIMNLGIKLFLYIKGY